uniref:Ig-like domain-containing protein n=1 Tax=Neovison vison TaxID=452646 RepID=A0A8C7BC53_NEOVI
NTMSPRVISLACLGRVTPSQFTTSMFLGIYRKPSLLAQSGRTVVRTGENVTLSCCSERSFDVYHLSRDEQPHECWLAKGQKHGSATQADFPLGPAHPAIGGTYRCHGSFNPSPCEWSGPSDPLFLSVTGEEVQNLPYAAIMNREPEVDRMVSREVGSEDPQEVTYTQLDHRIFMQKNTTPTSQRPGEPLHDESVHKSYAPRTHKKTLRRLSIDAIALSEHTPTQQQFSATPA